MTKMFRLDGFAVEHKATFTNILGKGQAQKLWREFSSAPVWVEGRARSGTGQCRRCMEVLATISSPIHRH